MSKRKKRSAADYLDKAFDMPMSNIANGSTIEFTSNKEAEIEGCRGVIEYNDEFIRLNLGNLTAKLCGRNLMIKALSDSRTVICGYITSLEFNG